MGMVKIDSQFGSGGAGLTDGTLRKALLQLQSVETVVAEGAAAETAIEVEGLKAGDVIISAVAYIGGVPTNVEAPEITEEGELKLATDTTGGKVVVTFVQGMGLPAVVAGGEPEQE